VFPEDDADRQMAIGFHLYLDQRVSRQFQVLNPAGGWLKLLECFKSDHVGLMDKFQNRFLILLFDFDADEGRLEKAKGFIPAHLHDRVFILGAWTEPQDLRSDLGPFEAIGAAAAKDCSEGTGTTWGHNLLRHNAEQVRRLRDRVRPILFPTA
jgi:hypothetical protein